MAFYYRTWWYIIPAIIAFVLSVIFVCIRLLVTSNRESQLRNRQGNDNCGIGHTPSASHTHNNPYQIATPMTGVGGHSTTPQHLAYPMTSQYGDPAAQQKY